MQKCLLSNPPYNMKWIKPALAAFMPKFAGTPIPPESNANFAFVLTALSLIDGKAALLLPNGVLTPSGIEKDILSRLIEKNVIAAAITLPSGMFESTSIPVCILVLDTHKETRKIELVDLREHGEEEIREQRGQFGGASHTERTYKKTVSTLSAEVMQRTVKAVETLADEKGFCTSVTPEQIASQDYCLTPSRYIETEINEIPHRSYADIATDYNRIIRYKNTINIQMNRTAAKRLGFDCLDHACPDLSSSFGIVGQTAEKEKFISFSASDGIIIKCGTKDGIPPLILSFLYHWKDLLIHLNTEENRLLAEFRDALLPDLMSGNINLADEENKETPE